MNGYYEFVWICMNIRVYCMDMYEFAWTMMHIYEYAWMRGYVWMRMSMYCLSQGLQGT